MMPAPSPVTGRELGQRIAAAALSFVGTPYGKLGRNPGVSLDCYGVCQCAGKAVGVVTPRFDINGYASLATTNSMRDHFAKYGDVVQPVRRDDLRAGDIVIVAFDTHRDGDPQHMGIVYDHDGFGRRCLGWVHADRSIGRGPDLPPGRVVKSRLVFTSAMRFTMAFRANAAAGD